MRLTFDIRKALCMGLFFVYSAEADPIRFLVTADPQYDNGSNNDVSDKTLRGMAQKKDADPNISGIIIAGDLTANTRPYDEYDQYTMTLGNIPGKSSPNVDALDYTYDGVGNHDLYKPTFWQKQACFWASFSSHKNCVCSDDIKKELKSRVRETKPFLRSGIHYTWKWGGITFVHLNLFPGNSNGFDGYSPENSLDFLKSVLATLDAKNDRITNPAS